MSVVNLRLARKAKARDGREAEAAANRVLHGRSGSERTARAIETSRATRLLDGHRLDGGRVDAPHPADRDMAPDDGD